MEKEGDRGEMAPEGPEQAGRRGRFHPLDAGDLFDEALEGRLVRGGELGGQRPHAVLRPVQGGLVVGGGDAVEGHVDADDPERQGGGFLVMGVVGSLEAGHLHDVPRPGIVIEDPGGLSDGGKEWLDLSFSRWFFWLLSFLVVCP